MNDTVERLGGGGGSVKGQWHVEPKEGTSHWVILVSVLLSLHSYQKGGRQDSHQLWL